ncbi:MAG: trypsin-like peptidase domain-containing protein [Clostridia bacterium]|nr:trypsin-like peptidase domain-containing protein [Clostridia bacterium]
MEENRFDIDPEKGNDEERNIDAAIEEAEVAHISSENDGEASEKEPEAEYAFRWSYTEQDEANKSKNSKSKKRGALTYAIVMTAAFVICFGFLLAVLLIDDFANITETKIIEHERTIYVREYDSESGVLTIPEIADKVKPSVVGIEITKGSGTGVGTGIIMSGEGYIATNAHVVENAETVKVIMLDGAEHDAKIIGRDELSDLAVVKIEAEDLLAAEFGKSEELIVGETAVAIGTPAGLELAGTVTSGIISAINRDVKIYDDATGTLKKTMTLIQTSAGINKGNSGGPLINDRGQVIGINTLKLADGYDGIGFAIPIDGALQILNKIIETGEDISENITDIAKKRAVIGIKGGAVNQMNGYPVAGVYVSEVNEGYDAMNHLKVGDIIVGINDFEVLAIDDISEVINSLEAGDTVVLKIYRSGDIFDVEITLGYEK